jgi:hypothetical protein
MRLATEWLTVISLASAMTEAVLATSWLGTAVWLAVFGFAHASIRENHDHASIKHCKHSVSTLVSDERKTDEH